VIPLSAFSVAANSVRQLLVGAIEDLEAGNVFISHPKEANPNPSVQALNLFFYRIDWDGYPADGMAEDPVYVRLECLITALGSAETVPGNDGGTVSAGESDLRLIGEVMRVLHQSPVVSVTGGDQPMQLQAVFQPLTLDQLNHLWSTQPDTSYRLSVAYQFALMPVPLATALHRSPRVAGVGVDALAIGAPGAIAGSGLPAGGGTPEVQRTLVDTAREDWVPHISFRAADGALRYVLRLPDIPAARQLQVLVAGAPGEPVQLVWEPWEWDYDANQGGWGVEAADGLSPEVTLPTGEDADNPFDPALIDPIEPEIRLAQDVQLPFSTDPGEQVRRQAMLYATRQWERSRPQADPQIVTLRSNPLLVSLYREGGGP
jgi:hypothetical protein